MNIIVGREGSPCKESFSLPFIFVTPCNPLTPRIETSKGHFHGFVDVQALALAVVNIIMVFY